MDVVEAVQVAMMIDLQALSHADGRENFTVDLDGPSPIMVESVVRRVPDKRLVCKGVWNQQKVYAKLFLGDNPEKYAMRDRIGVELLQQAGIATPVILYQGTLADRKGVALIFAEIPDSASIEHIWTTLKESARFNLTRNLVQTVAKHHNAGLLQTDLYLKNFLIQGEKIYTLDGDGIRKFNVFPAAKALENLCVLFSKLDVLELENWLPELVKTYQAARGWQETADLDVIKTKANQHRREVAAHYGDKKVFRTCTDVKLHTLRGLFYAVSRAYENSGLPTNAVELDTCFMPDAIIKNGHTCTLAAVGFKGKKIVIKRYNIKNVWHGISRALRQTRAAASWANAHRLKQLNIPTANPVALVEVRRLGLRGKAYFLTEYVDAPNLAEFFRHASHNGHRMATIHNIVTLLYRLFLLQISHGDMKATNIKVADNQPILIDLDSMHQHRLQWRALHAHVSDLRRFMRNWENEPTLYNAFVKAFQTVYKDQTPLEMAHFQNIKS